MARSTWLRVGGPVKVLFRPYDVDDLKHFMANTPRDIQIIPLGVASNVLIRDGGIDGVVIRLGFNDLTRQGEYLCVGAGVLASSVAKFAQVHGLSGSEFFISIPGTIGGALAMNAGAHGNDTATILHQATLVDRSGEIHTLKPQEIGYVYRGHGLPKDWIFVNATFKLVTGDSVKIQQNMQQIIAQRRATQPINSQTCGSIFKNPAHNSAWRLIDAAGCRGMQLGKALISHKHCNFLINQGGATAYELEELARKVIDKVKACSGIELEWEMIRLGNFA